MITEDQIILDVYKIGQDLGDYFDRTRQILYVSQIGTVPDFLRREQAARVREINSSDIGTTR
jgi:hypothetical protein